jgi:hypothetical protein
VVEILNYDYTWSDFVGNVGVALLIIAYGLNVTGRISAQGLAYNVTNLIVVILMAINLYFKPNLSSIFIEIFWGGFSIYGIINYYRQKHKDIV